MRALFQDTQTDRNTDWSMNHGRRVMTPGGQQGTVSKAAQGADRQNGQPSEQ